MISLDVSQRKSQGARVHGWRTVALAALALLAAAPLPQRSRGTSGRLQVGPAAWPSRRTGKGEENIRKDRSENCRGFGVGTSYPPNNHPKLSIWTSI